MNRRLGVFAVLFVVAAASSAAAMLARPAILAGTVKSVSDDGTEVIVVSGKGRAAKELRFRTDDSTAITLDGKEVNLTALKPGNRATLYYDRQLYLAQQIKAVTVREAPDKPEPTIETTDERPIRAAKKPVAKGRLRRSNDDAPGAQAAGEWPQFRGPLRDGISKETGLLETWPSAGPPLEWKANGLGEGYSSVSITGGRIYTMGNRGNEECVIALNADGGEQAWSTTISQVQANGGGYPGPRCIPTIDEGFVYALGLGGELVCLNAETGKERWRKNLARDFGGRMMSSWGFSESPLIDDDRLICTPGGDRATMVALNKNTGQPIWQAAAQNAGGAGYASPVVAEIGNVRQYITLVGRGIIGVNAKDGRVLWNYARVANGTANIPTPLVQDDLVFCSTGYNAGAALLKLSQARDGVRAEERYFLNGNQFQNHHGGMVLVDDHVYAGHGHNNGFPACLDLKTGRSKWGTQRGAGSGSAAVAYADGHLYFRYQNGTMALIEADPREYKLKSSFRIPGSGQPSWPHPVIAGGRLYLRDQDELFCYDIRANASAQAAK